jgi:hypothetical protein
MIGHRVADERDEIVWIIAHLQLMSRTRANSTNQQMKNRIKLVKRLGTTRLGTKAAAPFSMHVT